ncbi:hypothetical protein [Saccharolobus islandicus]|uniref:Uncharacterized protein n=3 Tax=Saccharolobus islandicus TaxID=43080 RepID=M9U7J6_SACIS|nr:hypothetical protein [Sulfolobus islandicus]ADX82073.1 hypothetical protein SiH_0716 [Sulfolobus islandicus HVE10/4]ADX84695.1 hypothetical protein SiRe_0612 [Sulfolobus islandicus REY15A]AGJ62112.1 Hypothetical Protein SiL_0652 [Sulfolobus islandicus LAL14/1]
MNNFIVRNIIVKIIFQFCSSWIASCEMSLTLIGILLALESSELLSAVYNYLLDVLRFYL